MNDLALENLAASLGDKDIKPFFTQYASALLNSFLQSGARLTLPTSDQPKVSIVLILFNRAELTFLCLRSLLENLLEVPTEVIIIDNNSTDQTALLLERIEGARIIRNPENLYYSAGVNQGVAVAQAPYVLLLNNDAQMLPGCLKASLDTLTSGAGEIGAVCGKIVLLDGSLQEAGSIVWSDGTCLGYGRGDNPEAPQYMFRRDVDYGSGALLLIDRSVFLELNGFDAEAFFPAYYEETDYCVRLWESGRRIVYEPRSVVLHYEFASQKTSIDAITLQQQKREVFTGRHQKWLSHQHSSDLALTPLPARTRSDKRRILFIDDRVPHMWRGAGHPRSNRILHILHQLEFDVTYYPTNPDLTETWDVVYSDIPREVEVMHGPQFARHGLKDFLLSRPSHYDTVLISRPHNMELINDILEEFPQVLDKSRLVYDAEAIFANREILYLNLKQIPITPEEKAAKIAQELSLAKNAALVTSVSEAERQNFVSHGYANAQTLGYCLDLQLTEKTFSERQDMLFVGFVESEETPNGDSLVWFLEAVLPLIQKQLDQPIRLKAAGLNISDKILSYSSEFFQPLGVIDDLTSCYDSCRLFVAPTRFAAGIPLKVYEAASRGIPTVVTPLIAHQVGWEKDSDLMVGGSPQEFADACVRLYTDEDLWQRLRQNAAKRVAEECSQAKFEADLQKILQL